MSGLDYLTNLEPKIITAARRVGLRWGRKTLQREPHPTLEEIDALVGTLSIGAVSVDVRLQVCTDGCHVRWFLSAKGQPMGESVGVPTTEDVAPHVISNAAHAMGHLGVKGLRVPKCRCSG